MKIKLPTMKCKRCGHEWYPKREEMPIRCAKCKTPYWNIPRVVKTALIIFCFLSFVGCKAARIAGPEKETPVLKLFVVACCRDKNPNGAETYPSFLPQSHIDLCEEARIADRTDGLINGSVYLAMGVDCGNQGYKIGDSYYSGRGY